MSKASRAKPDGDLKNVTPQSPCLVCGKPDWCSRKENGEIGICRRPHLNKHYHCYYTREGQGGVYGVFHLNPDTPIRPRWHGKKPATTTPVAPMSPKKVSSPEWLESLRVKFESGFTFELRAELARLLKLPLWALEARGVGAEELPEGDQDFWRTGELASDYVFTFAERDGAERIVGFNRRWSDGGKKQLSGTSRGLFVPEGWRDRPGPVYLVEGASDTLAMTAAGLCAIGRFSNFGKVDQLAELLCNLPLDRRIIVVGENDRDEMEAEETSEDNAPPGKGPKFDCT